MDDGGKDLDESSSVTVVASRSTERVSECVGGENLEERVSLCGEEMMVVEGEEEGDVMVEVSGLEVLVDGTRSEGGGGDVSGGEAVDEEVERKMVDEDGATDMELVGKGSERVSGVGHVDIVARSNETEDSARGSALKIAATIKPNEDVSVAEVAEEVREDCKDNDDKVMGCTAVVSESRSGEEVVLKEGDERRVSETNFRNQDDASVNGIVNTGGMRSEHEVSADKQVQSSEKGSDAEAFDDVSCHSALLPMEIEGSSERQGVHNQDENSDGDNGFCDNSQDNDVNSTSLTGDVGKASTAYHESLQGSVMEFDDNQNSENQEVDGKKKFDHIETNGDLHSHLECGAEGSQSVEMDIDAGITHFEKQDMACANLQDDDKMENTMKIENQLSAAAHHGPKVAEDHEHLKFVDKGHMAPSMNSVNNLNSVSLPGMKLVDVSGPSKNASVEVVGYTTASADGNTPNLVTSAVAADVIEAGDTCEKHEKLAETEVPDYYVEGDPTPRSDNGLELADHTDYGVTLLPNKSEELNLKPETPRDMEDVEELNQPAAIAETFVLMASSSDEEEMSELPDLVAAPQAVEFEIHGENRVLSKGSPILETEVMGGGEVSGLDAAPKQDGNEEYECHGAHVQLPLTQAENEGLDYAPDTSFAEGCFVNDAAPDPTTMEDIDEGLAEGQEVEEQISDSAKPRSKEEKHARRGSAKPGNVVKTHGVRYELPFEDEGDFAVFDLVWGKVKSHPWWPGQIFHPSDSSEKAMKYYRKDCYLVAYFGDRSFAWNEESVLKPFRKYFAEEEKQTNSEAFQNAVTCALDEVCRRVELGLACSCVSDEAYDKMKYQIVENAGIREESGKREGVDRSTGADSFQPDKLTKYVKALALSPSGAADKLDLVIAKAQLLAFNRLKGCNTLADFQYFEGLMEYDKDSPVHVEHDEMEGLDSVTGEDDKIKSKGTRKRKHDLKDIVYKRRKEKTITEIMGESAYYLDADFDSPEEDNLASPTSGTKRKGSGYQTGDFTSQPSTKTISVAKVSHTASPSPSQSFKVGECIRRVASQLTGSPSIIKATADGSYNQQFGDNNDEVVDTPDESVNEKPMSPQKQPSIEEMLSQLHLSARDPKKGYSYFGDVIKYFSEFRNLAVSTQRQQLRKASRKRKSSTPVPGVPETFEFDDRNDSYWTDMVVQNTSEAKPPGPPPARRARKKKDEQLLSEDPDRPVQSKPRKNSRKQYFHGNLTSAAEVPVPGNEKQHDQLPTELMMNFNDTTSIPSEFNLNKMFRRFGPLKESETEIDAQSSRARVVYKKRSDAEVAYSSAAMFNIFGSTLVNYQINSTPSVPFKTTPLSLTNGEENAT